MDIDEPLRKLLETTGWSCDDLLEKLQKLKSTQNLEKESSNDKKINSEYQQKKCSEECIADSTNDVNEVPSVLQSIDAKCKKTINSSVSTNRSKNDDFSDTDEDEAEVLVTNSNIIDEIIEDIFSSDITENGSRSPSKNISQIMRPANDSTNETSEVNEVKVIELDEDDDDRFEDECHGVDRFTPEKMEELEQLSRELTYTDEAFEEMETAVKAISSDSEEKQTGGGSRIERNNEIKKKQSLPFPKVSLCETLIKDIIEIASDSDDNDSSNKVTRIVKQESVDDEITDPNQENSVLRTDRNQYCGGQIEHIQSCLSVTKSTNDSTSNAGAVISSVQCIKTAEDRDPHNETNCQSKHAKALCENDKDYDSFLNSTHIPESSLVEKDKNEVTNFSDLICKVINTREETSNVISEKCHSAVNEQHNSNNIKTIDVDLDKSHCDIMNIEEVEESPQSIKINFIRISSSRDASFNNVMSPSSAEVATFDSNIELSVENNEFVDKTDSSNTMNSLSCKADSESDNNLTEPLDSCFAKGKAISVKHSDQLPIEDEESSSSDLNHEAPKNSDDIRNTIKMQLSSLRTKKKRSFLGTLNSNHITSKNTLLSENLCKSKLTDIDHENLENIVDKKEIDNEITNTPNCELDNAQSKEIRFEMYSDLDESKIQENSLQILKDKMICDSEYEDELYTQTNEFGLVISDVQGGIELDHIENGNLDNTLQSNNFDPLRESSNSLIKTSYEITVKEVNLKKNDTVGVFDEIRKIIRKQKSILSSQDISAGISNRTNHMVDTEKSFLSSADNSQISSPETSQTSFNLGDSTIQPTKKYSPFVSNDLDEFLTENSKLNISYNVPKCDAEEGLKEKYEESPLVVNRVVKLKGSTKEQPNYAKKVKAKTLAQKRKLLERQRQRELKNQEKLISEHTKFIKKENRAFVMFENKKIFVKTYPATENCIAVVDCTRHYKELKDPLLRYGKRKLSLLAHSEQHRNVKYLPGPLCKKPLLQLTGNTNWETKIKTLPKIFLEVSPSIGNPLPCCIWQHLPSQDGSLSTEQIEFALSVVKTNDENNCSRGNFSFPVKYCNNQDQVVVRKRKSSSSLPLSYGSKIRLRDTSDSFDKAVNDVIEGLLNYVEIKELAPTLIKKEEIICKNEDEHRLSYSAVDETVSIIRKPLKKKSKIDVELQRLNCKIVNVELETQEANDCNKPYCKLGCVCNSLKCESVINLHCQKYQCMFNCKCPKEKSIVLDHRLTLPAWSDIFSMEAVSRIEDEAKKHLAKVEREFTQTVIQTNDKTILLGLGTRSKTRRNTKTPVKYSEFVENERLVNIQDNSEKASVVLRNCKVQLPKLNLAQIVPYCLVHLFHDCHCGGHTICMYNKNCSELILEDKKYTEKNSGDNQQKKQKKRKFDFIKKEHKNAVPRLSTTEHVQKTKPESSSEIVSSTGRPIRTIKKPKLDDNFEYAYNNDTTISLDYLDCARVKQIDPQFFKKIYISEKMFQNDFIHNIRKSDMLKYKLFPNNNNQQDLSEAEILKWLLIKENINLEKISKNQNNRKRKQIINIRNESAASSKTNYSIMDGAMQRRKKVVTAVNRRDIRPVFEGEIVINETNMELLTRMGPRHVADGYARLLPWTNLIKNFNEGKINVWCMKDQSSKLMMNKAEYGNPPKNYVDIRHSKEKTMIINCILRNKLPEGYDQDNVSFILKETKNNYEICGLCAKNVNSETPKVSLGVNQAQFSESMETSFVHRDMLGAQRTLFMKKEKFKLQEILEEGLKDVGENSVGSSKLYMWAALPEIYNVCKWRVIYLNSDFTYLFFKKINYSIKYTDLLCAGMKAKEKKYTVLLRNIEMQKHYDHKNFGIYFDPHYQDRLFVGPYFRKYNENDIETLRYINGKLMCTESFNRMRGEGDYKCGHWLIERPYKSAAGSTIDLTEEKEENISNFTSEQQIFLHNDQEVKIINSVPKAPTEFNRYVITNIPHFGYLGALQRQNSEIDVQWPFEKKLLRFKNPNHAIDFLQTRFSSLLVSVPLTFKIVVLLLTSIDLEITHPIKTDILNGYHICGDFGFYSISDLTEENCQQKTGFLRADIIRAFLIKRQKILKDKAKQLASAMDIPEKQSCNIHMIIKKATTTIKKLHETNKQLMNEKSSLLLDKKSKASNVFKLISQLPPKQRYEESKKLMAVMNSSEPIEIVDSDEEKEGRSMSTTSSNLLVSTQQSLLKPLIRLPVSTGKSLLIRRDQSEATNFNKTTPKYIQGVKLVRKSSGKLVLVQDNSPVKKSPLSPGVKVTIKNNKIQSISRTGPDIDHDPSSIIVQTLNTSSDDEKDAGSQEVLSPEIETLKSPQTGNNNSRNLGSSKEAASVIDLCNENSSVNKIKLTNSENFNIPTDDQ